jgi:hypothetical protein
VKGSKFLYPILFPAIFFISGCELADPACEGATLQKDEWKPTGQFTNLIDELNVLNFDNVWTYSIDHSISGACGSSLLDIVCTISYSDLLKLGTGSIRPFLQVDGEIIYPQYKDMTGSSTSTLYWAYVSAFTKDTPANYDMRIGFMILPYDRYTNKLDLNPFVGPYLYDMSFTVEFSKLK